METFQYKFTRRPSFLTGCFHWKKHGYTYASNPEVDLLQPSALQHDDPWYRLASVLEHAKNGDASHLRVLEPFVRDESVDPTLLGGALDLIADAGGRLELEILADLMLDGTGYLKLQAVESARWAGVLWLIPYMIDVFEHCPHRTDREGVEEVISSLLEPRTRELEFFATGESPRQYAERVSDRVAQLVDEAGSDEIAVFAGEPIDMRALIWRMHRDLREEPEDRWASFLLLRHKLEAYTGVDCTQFYRDGVFRPLSARVALEEYMKANPELRFEVGRRYFFGWRVG